MGNVVSVCIFSPWMLTVILSVYPPCISSIIYISFVMWWWSEHFNETPIVFVRNLITNRADTLCQHVNVLYSILDLIVYAIKYRNVIIIVICCVSKTSSPYFILLRVQVHIRIA